MGVGLMHGLVDHGLQALQAPTVAADETHFGTQANKHLRDASVLAQRPSAVITQTAVDQQLRHAYRKLLQADGALALNAAIYVRHPALADERAFLSAVRASRRLHHP